MSRTRNADLKPKLSLAYSPCPNDTFIFGPLATGLVTSPDFEFAIELHDVETLNQRALSGDYDISKVSFHAYLHARNHYRLLDAGAALGYGCGPLVVARRPDALASPEKTLIAVPGKLTTASLLLQLWQPRATRVLYLTYDEIIPALLAGRADAGVIIHESRFTYEESGLVALADLGGWWETQTGLPIPLGGIVARNEFGPAVAEALGNLVRDSIDFSRRNPESIADYINTHAQEISATVQHRHIDMFVNAFSLSLGEEGRAAVERLSRMAEAKGTDWC